MRKVLRFNLPQSAQFEDVSNDVALAVFTGECIHGRPRTRIEASYLVSGNGRRCLISVGGPAGESVASVFAGLCGERFGEEGFQVEELGPRHEAGE